MHKLILPFATCFFLFACADPGPQAERRSTADETSVSSSKGSVSVVGGAVPAPAQMDRKIIRTGDLRYEVGDLDAAHGHILEQVGANGGHMEGDDRNDLGSAIDLTMRVRIPADRFDAFLSSLKGLGELLDQHISANDVTAQWVDVEARLMAKRKVEERFLVIVGQARTVTDLLEVERELGNVRAEIESMEARMKALKDQVGMSTLTITCTKSIARNDRYTPHFGVAVREGWNLFVKFLVGVLHLWPFFILAGGVVFWLAHRRKAGK